MSRPETAHVSAKGIEERGHRSRLSGTCCSETSTAQYIIYNINRAVWNSRCPAKTPRQSCPGVPLPLPRPPKKKINNPPKNVSPSNLPSPVRCPRDRSHRQAPIRESSASDPCKGFPPKTRKPRVDVIKNAPVEPSCHCTGTTTVVRSNQNVTYVIRDALRTTKSHLKTSGSIIPPPSAMRSRARAMGQGYPPTGPSPGANPPIYPSSLPLASGNLLSNIFSKSHGFFSLFFPFLDHHDRGISLRLWRTIRTSCVRKLSDRAHI